MADATDRLCSECGKLVDNYGRCRTKGCALDLKPQHPNVSFKAKSDYGWWKQPSKQQG